MPIVAEQEQRYRFKIQVFFCFQKKKLSSEIYYLLVKSVIKNCYCSTLFSLFPFLMAKEKKLFKGNKSLNDEQVFNIPFFPSETRIDPQHIYDRAD